MRPERFRIREASPSDAASIAALATQLGYPSSEAAVRERMAAMPENMHGVLYVGEVAGEVVGWVQVYVVVGPESDMTAHIGGLVVDEPRRRSGIGKLLMQHAESWAAACGCGTVALYSNRARKPAHRFYRSIGYTHYKSSLGFRRTLDL